MESLRTTILYDNRRVVVDRVDGHGDSPAALWIDKGDVSRVNGFTVEPYGACRGDLCVPVPNEAMRGNLFDLAAFARSIGQTVVAEPEARVWSFGQMQAVGSGLSRSRVAPDFEVPDRTGRPVRLSDFRGKKTLLVTWASW
jgi:hypothetical protein